MSFVDFLEKVNYFPPTLFVSISFARSFSCNSPTLNTVWSPNALSDVGALCAMLGAEGTASSGGHVAGFGTGADGSGLGSSNAVKRFAGITSGSRSTNNVIGSSVVRLPKAIAMFASRACRVSLFTYNDLSYSLHILHLCTIFLVCSFHKWYESNREVS